LGSALAEDATLSVEVVPNADARILQSTNLDRAGLNVAGQEELEANLTIRATDGGNRSFDLDVECLTSEGQIDITISDKDLIVVGRARILCESTAPPPPQTTAVSSDCYSVTGKMDGVVDVSGTLHRDEPVVASYVEHEDVPPGYSNLGDHYVRHNDLPDEYRWGAEDGSNIEYLTSSRTVSLAALRANPEMGQDTVQVLEDSDDVQITVTSCEDGPAYIRFLDEDGKPFGTDVDELSRHDDPAGPGVENEGDIGDPGASVTGLDSQGKLVMNLMSPLSAAAALMYDQYSVVQSTSASVAPHLVGTAGSYYQGKFRFYAPCEWGPFQVQVHEPSGKVLQELQNGMMSDEVTCVPAEQAEAQPIEVVQGSRADREMIVRWQPIADAVEYTVVVLDTSDPAMYTVPYVEMFDASATRETTVTGLTSGTRYIYAVYAELPGGTYSPVEFVINTPEF
jgi:hypothetical protein